MNSEPAGDVAFWKRVVSAIYRLIALAIFVFLHYGLTRLLAFAGPPGLGGALEFTEAAIYVIFLLVYVYLAWDMLTVFLPQLKVAFTASSKLLEREDNEKSRK